MAARPTLASCIGGQRDPAATGRRRFVAAASLLTLAPGLGWSQPLNRLKRIGILGNVRPPAQSNDPVSAVIGALRDLGWSEGSTLAIETRWADQHYERFEALARELVAANVDLIIASAGVTSALAAKKATLTIPILALWVADPVGTGLVASLARPGGNVTGLTNQVDLDFDAKRLELLLEAVPGVTRVAALQHGAWVRALPARQRQQHVVEEAARSLGVQLQIVEVETLDEIESAFAAMTREGAEALLVFTSTFFSTHGKRIVELAAQHRLPAIYPSRTRVAVGGLMSYDAGNAELTRCAASYVDRILKGAKPADLPVEQPTKFALVLNLKTAKALGITFPPTLLIQADEVIQ